MTKKILFVLIGIQFFLIEYSWASQLAKSRIVIMFWNVENYFDPFNDPKTADDDFTSLGEKHWSWKKFLKKRDGIAKVIISLDNGNFPAIVGLAEVENRFVLEQLIKSTPLAKIGYNIIHRDSPDARGIDVAMIYRRDVYRPILNKFFHVSLPDTTRQTRLILYSKGVIDDLDTLHLFINHWPSKLGGALISNPKRESASKTLLQKCDSILKRSRTANIILMGDFNDNPDSPIFNKFSQFINITQKLLIKGEGSIKYMGKWDLIDQFFISKTLLDIYQPIYCDTSVVFIYKQKFLMEKDKDYLGLKPKRVYRGPIYNGGLSDHLPIVMSINKY